MKKQFFTKDFADWSSTQVHMSAKEKATFCAMFKRFIERGFDLNVLRQQSEHTLTLICDLMAVSGVRGADRLYARYFLTPPKQLASINAIVEVNKGNVTPGKWGKADMYRAIVAYIAEEGLVGQLERKANEWVDETERAELARLLKKYGAPV